MTFTMHEEGEFVSNQIIGYRVGGLPNGTTARLANFGAGDGENDWRISSMGVDGTPGEWTGHYASVEDALAELAGEQK